MLVVVDLVLGVLRGGDVVLLLVAVFAAFVVVFSLFVLRETSPRRRAVRAYERRQRNGNSAA